MEIQEGTGRISGGGKTGERSKTFIIDIPFNPKDYVVFRSCVSLVGDVYHLITPLIKENRLAELLNPLKELMDSADKFRDLRNFLTHIDERFTEKRYNKIEKHSIALTDENGHHESFYFVYSDGIIRFTEFETVKQVPFDVESFKPIFMDMTEYLRIISCLMTVAVSRTSLSVVANALTHCKLLNNPSSTPPFRSQRYSSWPPAPASDVNIDLIMTDFPPPLIPAIRR
nr:hypothetical protein [Paenibacillus lactis]